MTSLVPWLNYDFSVKPMLMVHRRIPPLESKVYTFWDDITHSMRVITKRNPAEAGSLDFPLPKLFRAELTGIDEDIFNWRTTFRVRMSPAAPSGATADIGMGYSQEAGGNKNMIILEAARSGGNLYYQAVIRDFSGTQFVPGYFTVSGSDTNWYWWIMEYDTEIQTLYFKAYTEDMLTQKLNVSIDMTNMKIYFDAFSFSNITWAGTQPDWTGYVDDLLVEGPLQAVIEKLSTGDRSRIQVENFGRIIA